MLKAQETRQADVLEVISNLSSDEVFTPPKVVNEMLDVLPEEVWRDPSLRWLDPGTKTGVFLREITRRLMVGLEDEISDEQQRLQHILKEMVFGIAITELTALMARRTLYCSKDASSERSLVEMPTSEGNIWFQRTKHLFGARGKCTECGASKDQIERGEDLENYAYGFIHTDGRKKIEEVMEMKFDVIVGNPPYQMDIGATSDVPLYDRFVQRSIELAPSHVVMIIPSRWMQGGKNLSAFRELMLGSRQIRHLVDYVFMSDVFPGEVDFEGGVCYFHYDTAYEGLTESTYVQGGQRFGPSQRDIGEFDVFVRDERALSILRKVLKKDESKMSTLVSGQTPFGLFTNFSDFRKAGRKSSRDLKLHLTRGGKREEKWMDSSLVGKGESLIRKWKVLVPKAFGERGSIPARVLGPPLIAGPKSVCTQSYLAIGPFATKDEALSCETYLRTRFLRFMLSLRKISQDNMRGVWSWAPQQSWDREWTDEELYEKYGITKKEQAYIEEMIKEMPSE